MWNFEGDRKKQRGQYRRCRALLKNIEAINPYQNTMGECEHFHVPGSSFLEHPKTVASVKTAFCRKWLEKTEEIRKQKPEGLPFCKVVAMVNEPFFWSSQIIIFYDREYYDGFWKRTSKEQVWEPLEKNRVSFIRDRHIETVLDEKGYMETISDDEGSRICSLLWFYGDI